MQAKKGKRGIAGAVGLSALLAAGNADAAQEVMDVAVDGRFGILLLILGPAVGWVLYNILGPALNQVDSMSAKKK